MRRILLIVLISSLLTALGAGAATARLAGDQASADRPVAAPFRVPASVPDADPIHEGAYGYRPAARIAAGMRRDASRPGSDAAARGASATVTVTATVLPTATIRLDAAGTVSEIVVNTPSRGAREVLFMIRDASDAPVVSIDADEWRVVRAALGGTSAGTGVVYAA